MPGPPVPLAARASDAFACFGTAVCLFFRLTHGEEGGSGTAASGPKPCSASSSNCNCTGSPLSAGAAEASATGAADMATTTRHRTMYNVQAIKQPMPVHRGNLGQERWHRAVRAVGNVIRVTRFKVTSKQACRSATNMSNNRASSVGAKTCLSAVQETTAIIGNPGSLQPRHSCLLSPEAETSRQ